MKLFQILLLCLAVFTLGCGQKTDPIISTETSPYFLKQDKRIAVDGLDIRYRDEGPKTAKAIIMVHGFTSSLETWDRLAEKLKTDYRVIRLDLPGHGLTGPDPQGRYTNEETVKILADFIQILEIEKPLLIGNSLGGLLSWRLAVLEPDFLRGLVLLSPGGFSINGVTEEPADVPMMVKFYLTKAPAAGVKQATAALFANPEKLTDARLDSVIQMMTWPGNGNAFVERAASFTLPDPVADLGEVTVPTLIIWGDKDIMVPVSHGDKFLSAIPNSNLKIYVNTGHLPQEEKPEKLAADVKKFLTKLDAK